MRLIKKKIYTLIIMAFGLTTGGCSYRIIKDSNNFETMFIPRELLESISFQEIKNKIFIPKCISCHGDSGNVNLESYANAKLFLVELKNKYKVPDLLEANNTTTASDKLLIIKERYLEEHGKPDYDAILGEWKNWAREHLLKRVLVEAKRAQ